MGVLLSDVGEGADGVDDGFKVAVSGPRAGGEQDDVVDAKLPEAVAAVRELVDGLAWGEATAQRDLDVVGVAAGPLALFAEDVELVSQGGAAVGDVEEVARVGVAGHEGQRSPFSHATDQDLRSGHGWRVV